MSTQLKNLYESIRQSLWLLPALAIVLALVIAAVMDYVEGNWARNWGELPYLYTGGPDASRTILSALTSSLITVAGVTFSITIVSLTLASSQFGPRLLRNFLRSFPSQVTLGALMGSFVYGILVMSTIDSEWQAGQAHPSITLIFILATGCVCLLVYYIHHVATSIQADALIAAVYVELEERIDDLDDLDHESDESDLESPKIGPAVKILSWRSGYVTAIDCSGLATWASEANTVTSLTKRPGQFIARGELLAEVSGKLSAKLVEQAIRDRVYLNDKRTPEQDLEFLIDQLVEVALRAISPGINDPNTALVCIDYLAAAICQLTPKALPRSFYRDKEGIVRVYSPQTDYEGLINDAFDQLRQCGRKYPEIVIRLAESLTRIAHTFSTGDSRSKALQQQYEQLRELANDQDNCASKDQSDIEAALRECKTALA